MRERRPNALTVKEHMDPEERVSLRMAKRAHVTVTRTPRKRSPAEGAVTVAACATVAKSNAVARVRLAQRGCR